MKRKTCKVLGYDVDLLSFKQIVKLLDEKLENSVGMHIITINPEMINEASKNPEFSDILTSAELVVPDGAGIELALKIKGITQERIAGIDLAKELIDLCYLKELPVALIGAKDEVLHKTVCRLFSEFDGLKICYYKNGFFTSNKEKEIIEGLVHSQPRLVLVAMGAPRQEFFIKKCRELLPNTIFIGVGGTFDVWAGELERAPKFIQDCRLEWLYRTIKQPQRLKRVCTSLPRFVIRAIMDFNK